MNSNSLSQDEQSFFGSLSIPKQEVTPQGNVKTIYLSPEESSFFDSIPEMQVEDTSFLGRLKKSFRDFTEGQNEILRGAIKGIGEFGEMISPSGESIPEKELRMETLRELLPSKQSEGTETRERFGEVVAPALLTGSPGQALFRSALSVEGEKVGEKLGGTPGKLVGGILPFVAPDPRKYIMAANQTQKKLLDFGREMGLSEKQLAIATKPDTKFNNILASFSIRRGPAKARLEQTKKGMDKLYQKVESMPEANAALEVDQLSNFQQHLETQMQKLSHSERQQILPDVMDFWHSKRTGKDLMNLHHDVNKMIMETGKDQFGLLKGAIEIPLGELSPKLAMDFNLTQNLYANYARIRGQMSTGKVDDILTGIKAMTAATALITGNYPTLYSMAGITAARSAATALMISPRLQNLQHKMLQAINTNKYPLANKFLEEFKEIIKTDAPNFYDLTKNESITPSVVKAPKKGSDKTK